MDTGAANTTKLLATAIYKALRKGDPGSYMSQLDLDEPVVIDGEFDLLQIASALLDSCDAETRRVSEGAICLYVSAHI